MIQQYATDLAKQMGIELSRVSFFNGQLLGCRDCHLLQLHSEGHMESAVVYQQDLEYLQQGTITKRLETRLRSVLSRLQAQLGLNP